MIAKIAKISSLPQVIVATVDYDQFGVGDGGKAHKIYLTEQLYVLNKATYDERAEEIEGMYQLLESNNLS